MCLFQVSVMTPRPRGQTLPAGRKLPEAPRGGSGWSPRRHVAPCLRVCVVFTFFPEGIRHFGPGGGAKAASCRVSQPITGRSPLPGWTLKKDQTRPLKLSPVEQNFTSIWL